MLHNYFVWHCFDVIFRFYLSRTQSIHSPRQYPQWPTCHLALFCNFLSFWSIQSDQIYQIHLTELKYQERQKLAACSYFFKHFLLFCLSKITIRHGVMTSKTARETVLLKEWRVIWATLFIVLIFKILCQFGWQDGWLLLGEKFGNIWGQTHACLFCFELPCQSADNHPNVTHVRYEA